MKIILSPAKQMVVDTEKVDFVDLPHFIDRAETVLDWLHSKSHEELKTLWGCNDKIAEQNFRRIENMDLKNGLTPAVIAYDGIAFKYMAPAVFEKAQLAYVQKHLRILSAFYGVLKPMDGVTPYRLEMQAKAAIGEFKNLYDFWGSSIYDEVVAGEVTAGDYKMDEAMTGVEKASDRIIINLASKEYSKCVEKYLKDEDRYITISFVEEVKGKMVSKGTYAKMARGEMVRYMADFQVKDPEKIKKFDRLGYTYRDDLSSDEEFVFQRVGETK